MAKTQTDYYPLAGGLDVVTPPLSLLPGRLLAAVNFEPWFNGGYRRVDGFERFDGRDRPSQQNFIGFDVTSVEDIVVGSTVTGQSSGATGVVIGVYEDDGTYGIDSMGVTKVTGNFELDESLGVSATDVDEVLHPDNTISDVGGNLISGKYTDIDEYIGDADSLSGLYRNDDVPALRTVSNGWSGDSVDIPMADLDASTTAVNSWVLSVRARVLRDGPESDDTVSYRLNFSPGPDSEYVEFTEGDAGGGWITRTVTKVASSATESEVNAADVVFTQYEYINNGYGEDGLRIEVDCVEVDVTVDGDVTVRNTPVIQQAPNQTIEDEFLAAAWNEYREDIDVVPGSGQVNGAWRRLSDTFAIRDNAGATAGVLHLSSTTGWTETGITMTDVMYFDAGTEDNGNFIVEGDTIAGATSGATATVYRLIEHGGSLANDDTYGYMTLTDIAGGPFTDDEFLTVNGNIVATVDGDSEAFVFGTGGKYRFHNHNFYGGSLTYRVYGCSGNSDPAFEIDEYNVVSPILLPKNPVTNQPADNDPYLLEEHRNYLFLAFPGGIVTQCVQGEPLNFTGFLGAAEYGMGDNITGLNSIVGGVLVITSERETRGLFGKTTDDFELRLIGERTGGRLYSTQKLDTVYALDDLGITEIKRTDAFGDFVGSTVSQLVQPIVQALRETISDSTVVRTSNQYRLYFSDNSCLIMYMPAVGDIDTKRGLNTRVGAQFGFASYPFAVDSIWSTDDEDGVERRFFTTDDSTYEGFVFEDGSGNNFDGDGIDSYIRTAFNFLGTPAHRKRFRRADIEISAEAPIVLKFTHDLSFGSSDLSSGITDITADEVDVVDVFAGGGFWDTDNWDEFNWDGQNISTARAYLNGTGENIGFLMYNSSDVAESFTLQGLTVHFDVRRLQR